MARPVYLYLFERGAQQFRRSASSRDVLAIDNLWPASSISHTEPEMSGEAERDAVRVTLPLSDAFANDLIRNRPDGQVLITIYKFERSDGSYEYEWSGRLTVPEVSGGEVALRFEPDSSGLAGAMLPVIAMRQCPHTQYVGACRLDREDFRIDTTLLSVSGSVITVEVSSEMEARGFAGGFVQAQNGDTRTIKAYSNGTITLVRPLNALLSDVEASEPTISLYPSCGRVPAGCASFANSANDSGTNIENYGGFLWMLTGEVNPFGGSSVI